MRGTMLKEQDFMIKIEGIYIGDLYEFQLSDVWARSSPKDLHKIVEDTNSLLRRLQIRLLNYIDDILINPS